MIKILSRELVYLTYYVEVQLRQILPYYLLGILIGSVIAVFFKQHIHKTVEILGQKEENILGIAVASFLGVLSPLCMYGTIPLTASLSKSGVKNGLLASFMMSSILLNPQLIIYSASLGIKVLTIRIISCLFCGFLAGCLIKYFFTQKSFFNFSSFDKPNNSDTDPNMVIRLLKNIGRNLKVTGPYFIIGILFSALFQRFVSTSFVETLFGPNNGFGVLMAATIGVPLYACGGGTIPLLLEWLHSGMSLGSATAFMITGPATKITNLGALKIVLGWSHFILYLTFIIIFSLVTGLLVNFVL